MWGAEGRFPQGYFGESPRTESRSNQSILKEISPEYSLEGLMLKLILQYVGHWCKEPTHWKRPWCWERLKAGGEGDDRGWDGWMASPTQWTWVWVDSSFFIAQLSHPYMTTGKTIALTIQTFVGKVMSLHFNTLSNFVIAFLPRSTHLLISWL